MNTPLEIKRIDIDQRIEVDLHAFKNRQAMPADCSTLIDYPCAIYEKGELKVVYLWLDEDSTHLVKLLKKLPFIDSRRSSGMAGQTRTVGYSPRRPLRADFCNLSSMALENPDTHKAIVEYAEKVTAFYEQHNPELYSKHQSLMGKVLPQYQLPGQTFTSGIVNKNNAIPYHFDAGNFEDVWSCMLTFIHGIEGGELCCPEYDVRFKFRTNSLFMFDGQGLLHGVTPIIPKLKDFYRFTIVYYSLRMMWNCQPLSEELIRIRQLKTKREIKRAEAAQNQQPQDTDTSAEADSV